MTGFTTRFQRWIAAPRAAVYLALIDARSVQKWMVPTGMSSHVHEFHPHEGGTFRISLTYDSPDGVGKTTARTDTYHGAFVALVPDERVVQVMEFESADPGMAGEMRVTFSLTDVDGGTQLDAVHENVPLAVPAADNELGWTMSLQKLADLVESEPA